jgi:hypothetical protein
MTGDALVGKTIAIMQPYFFPYAGYYRLFAQADEFILFDTAQFIRRGRIHRCEVPGPGGIAEWLTLPLLAQPQQVLIGDLRFAPEAREKMDQRIARLPWIRTAGGPNADRIRAFLQAPLEDVTDYLEQGLRMVLDILGVPAVIRRSSTLPVPADLKGPERIIALCRAVGATRYLNSPGGRHLYEPTVFAEAGIKLDFLPDYTGPHAHMIPALMQLPPSTLRADVLNDGSAKAMH